MFPVLAVSSGCTAHLSDPTIRRAPRWPAGDLGEGGLAPFAEERAAARLPLDLFDTYGASWHTRIADPTTEIRVHPTLSGRPRIPPTDGPTA